MRLVQVSLQKFCILINLLFEGNKELQEKHTVFS